ncbi:hypothetical protein OS035_24380 [Rhizobium sp. 268]|uniref:hypothetical protein n=1 Tax=Rhizobium sp. 268 TaxID=2996375 RepID=UPI002F93FF39
MPRRIWDNDRFRAWMTACGLSAPMAADILQVGERTVKRMLADDVGIKDIIAAKAEEFLGNSRTTSGRDAELLDSYADQADFAQLCAAFPHAHLTGMSSAIARGWTSANSNFHRHVSQPVRMPQPAEWVGFQLEWWSANDLPWGVECRLDTDGRPYRVASAERTLLELADHEGPLGEADVKEAYAGAFARSEQRPDVLMVRQRAKLRGGPTPERVYHYIKPYPSTK